MGKTVTTYFLDGETKGIQYSFIENQVCQMFVVPRSELSAINKQEKLKGPALYILLGENEETKMQAYIGETSNFCNRVKNHDNDKNKDFWQKALVFVSRVGDMNKADVLYLEYRAIREAEKAEKIPLLDNKKSSNSHHLAPHQQDTDDKFFEDVKFLTSFIGCNIFDVTKNNNHLFYARGQNYNTKGYYDVDGFTILKGSVIASKTSGSIQWKKKREALLEEHAIEEKGVLVLTSDIVFSSPSAAASFCMGSSQNGWKVWKDENDETLDFVYRQSK